MKEVSRIQEVSCCNETTKVGENNGVELEIEVE